jgi:protein TonB
MAMVQAIRTPHAALHLDGKRIAGLATAILLNSALLLLLLVPIAAPPPLSPPDPTPIFQWITPTPVTPPVPPKPVRVTKAHPLIQPQQPVVRQPTTQSETPPIVVPQADPFAITTPPETTETQSNDKGQTAPAGVRLEYADAPAPAYPRDALRDGAQGTVLLQVLVDVDGRPLQVDVQHSSGDRRLDLAARKQVLEHWRFRPAMRDGRAVQAIGLVPIAFNLD